MDDLISRQEVIDTCLRMEAVTGYDAGCLIAQLPSAQLTEEYAKAVRNWLVQYQVKCAELSGRYTPYEVLGWIVSDWRKENGIW